ARGEAALAAGKLPTLAQGAGAGLDAKPLLASREVDVMTRQRWLELNSTWGRRFGRYARLHHDWDRRTVALFVRPVERNEAGGGGGGRRRRPRMPKGAPGGCADRRQGSPSHSSWRRPRSR